MKFSIARKIVWCFGILSGLASAVWAQNQWIDSILPPDHLLENLPWMGEDGKIESKGLFDFEDLRSSGQKDLILIYRQSVPVNELDKPHNQTLVVCFFDPKTQKYIKNFEDEGGTIQWVKLLSGPTDKKASLIMQRDDLKGNQVLKGFAYLNGGMKQVLEAVAPHVFVKFLGGPDGQQIACSSKEVPKDAESAEHVFSWNNLKDQFAEGKSPGMAGWTGASIEIPAAPVTEAKATPEVEQPDQTKPQTAAGSATQAKSSHPSKGGWWDEPIDLNAASTKLDTELVPNLIQKGQIAVLGQKAKAFFTAAQKQGIGAKEVNSARASYYAAVASAVLDSGDKKGANYYLKTALSFQADNQDALALKEKMK
ncbi:MAG TPA: hypothetical protein VMV05_12120 [bacterium]|nr:hypothetical protein [bacterium]